MKKAHVAGFAMCVLTSSACGVDFPGDRGSWAVRSTPNAVSDAPTGSLFLSDQDDVAMLFETDAFQADPLAAYQTYDISWEGTWEFDGERATLVLACTSADFSNMPTRVDCPSATLTLTCQMAKQVLDCGDYSFR